MADLGTTIKSIPQPVLIGLGGAVIGLGYIAFRSRGENQQGEEVPYEEEIGYGTPVADAYAGTTEASYVPSGVAYVGGAGAAPDESASTVGAVGQTALDTLGSIANTALTAALQQRTGPDPELVASIAAARQPAPVIVMPSPQPPPPARPATPAAANKDKLRPGYRAGNSVAEAKHKKVFPGALGWVRLKSGGTGRKHWIDYHIQFPKGKLQRWRYWPNDRGRWQKIWGN